MKRLHRHTYTLAPTYIKKIGYSSHHKVHQQQFPYYNNVMAVQEISSD